MWRQWAFLTVLMAVAPQCGLAFDLLTTHEPVRRAQAPGGLLYCLAKGHTVFRVESPTNPSQPAVELAVYPAPVETIKRREIVLIEPELDRADAPEALGEDQPIVLRIGFAHKSPPRRV